MSRLCGSRALFLGSGSPRKCGLAPAAAYPVAFWSGLCAAPSPSRHSALPGFPGLSALSPPLVDSVSGARAPLLRCLLRPGDSGIDVGNYRDHLFSDAQRSLPFES